MYFLNLPSLLRYFIHVYLYHLLITWHVDVVAYARLKLLWSLYTARVASRKCLESKQLLCNTRASVSNSVQEAADGVEVAALGSNQSAESSGNDRRHISPRLLSLVEPPEWFQGL